MPWPWLLTSCRMHERRQQQAEALLRRCSGSYAQRRKTRDLQPGGSGLGGPHSTGHRMMR